MSSNNKLNTTLLTLILLTSIYFFVLSCTDTYSMSNSFSDFINFRRDANGWYIYPNFIFYVTACISVFMMLLYSKHYILTQEDKSNKLEIKTSKLLSSSILVLFGLINLLTLFVSIEVEFWEGDSIGELFPIILYLGSIIYSIVNIASLHKEAKVNYGN